VLLGFIFNTTILYCNIISRAQSKYLKICSRCSLQWESRFARLFRLIITFASGLAIWFHDIELWRFFPRFALTFSCFAPVALRYYFGVHCQISGSNSSLQFYGRISAPKTSVFFYVPAETPCMFRWRLLIRCFATSRALPIWSPRSKRSAFSARCIYFAAHQHFYI